MPQLFDAMTYEMQQDYQKRIKELEGYDFSAYNILTVREEFHEIFFPASTTKL